jgi:hypothetical protein
MTNAEMEVYRSDRSQMQQILPSNACWVNYVCGARNIFDAMHGLDPATGSEPSLVLGWLYFFDLIARFGVRHWRTKQIEAIAKELGFNSRGDKSCIIQYMLLRASLSQPRPNLEMHVHPVIQLLAEVTDVVMYSSDPRYNTVNYRVYLSDLRLRMLAASSSTRGSLPVTKSNLDATVQEELEFTRLAGLIYLERISEDFSGDSTQISSWTQQALSILENSDLPPCSFALFIIGCEANVDKQRISLLDFFAKMEAKPHLRTFTMAKSLIETAWNQHDLIEEGQFQYARNINLTISSRDIPPALV